MPKISEIPEVGVTSPSRILRVVLPRTVGPEQAVDVTRRDFEGNALECRDLTAAEGNGEDFPEIPDADGDFLHVSR